MNFDTPIAILIPIGATEELQTYQSTCMVTRSYLTDSTRIIKLYENQTIVPSTLRTDQSNQLTNHICIGSDKTLPDPYHIRGLTIQQKEKSIEDKLSTMPPIAFHITYTSSPAHGCLKKKVKTTTAFIYAGCPWLTDDTSLSVVLVAKPGHHAHKISTTGASLDYKDDKYKVCAKSPIPLEDGAIIYANDIMFMYKDYNHDLYELYLTGFTQEIDTNPKFECPISMDPVLFLPATTPIIYGTTRWALFRSKDIVKYQYPHMPDDGRPLVFSGCGHIFRSCPDLEKKSYGQCRQCPICRTAGCFIKLQLDTRAILFGDTANINSMPLGAFQPCGHAFWSQEFNDIFTQTILPGLRDIFTHTRIKADAYICPYCRERITQNSIILFTPK